MEFIAPLVETLDLYHNQTVEPRAIALAFNKLREQNPDADLNILAMEKRGQNKDKLLLKVETNPQADVSQLHSQYFEQYDYLLTLPPQALQALILEKDKHIAGLEGMLRMAIAQPKTQIDKFETKGDTTVAESNPGAPKYDQRGAQFAGGFAETVHGNQYGGTINNYGASLDDITRLLSSLREQAQVFPGEQKDEALDVLDDLESDLQKPEPDRDRLSRRLKRLIAIAAAVATIAGSAATFSGNLNDFTGNIVELTETLGIPIEQIQPHPLPSAETP